jgi:nucleotide-binding universal stress UspA family protein
MSRAELSVLACTLAHLSVKVHMKDVQKILVPVDFSENSARALEYAARLARLFGATIEVLHVWSVPSLIPEEALVTAGQHAVKLIEFVQSNAETELRKFVSRAVDRGIVVARTRAEPGIASRVILDAVKDGSYDLIVMGTRGQNSLSDVLLGSVAERVVRRATCPVVTIRDDAR